MALWTSISSSRYASGTLFAADLAIDLIGRDFGHTVYCDPSIGVTTGSTFDAWTDLTSVWVAFPDSWNIDMTYPAVFTISLPVLAKLDGLEWNVVDTFKLRLTSAGDEASVPLAATDQAVTLTLTYNTTPPTGLTELSIQYYISPAGTAANMQLYAPRGGGPATWLGFVQL